MDEVRKEELNIVSASSLGDSGSDMRGNAVAAGPIAEDMAREQCPISYVDICHRYEEWSKDT